MAVLASILDHLDKIASIVAAVFTVIAFTAARRRVTEQPADAPDPGQRPGPWWTSRRLHLAALVGMLVSVGLAVRVVADGGSAPEPPRSLSSAPVTRSAPATGATPGPGDLRPDSAVPLRYRDAINAAGRSCHRPGVTPALVAAMLFAESGFDPDKRSPQTDEYGIAMWTPTVFKRWAPTYPDRTASYLNPDDAIAAMGSFLCELAQTVGPLGSDPQPLIAAGYRVGGRQVRAANGVPPSAAAYVAVVREKIIEYGY